MRTLLCRRQALFDAYAPRDGELASEPHRGHQKGRREPGGGQGFSRAGDPRAALPRFTALDHRRATRWRPNGRHQPGGGARRERPNHQQGRHGGAAGGSRQESRGPPDGGASEPLRHHRNPNLRRRSRSARQIRRPAKAIFRQRFVDPVDRPQGRAPDNLVEVMAFVPIK
jgi:hypothetical protein